MTGLTISFTWNCLAVDIIRPGVRCGAKSCSLVKQAICQVLAFRCADEKAIAA